MDVGCYTVKLQICCFNFCLLYMYMYGVFFYKVSKHFAFICIGQIKLTKYIDEFQ